MLEVAGLSVQYGQHRAVDDVALTVAASEIVVILGANGSGKSSLLKAVAGLQSPGGQARVTLAGRELAGLPAHAIVEAGLALVPEALGPEAIAWTAFDLTGAEPAPPPVETTLRSVSGQLDLAVAGAARTLVALGVDFGAIVTRGTLRAGLAHAERVVAGKA